MNLAPIILFVYNRPDHTRQTIEALLANPLAKDSDLYIYSDAPKNHEAEEKVSEVRKYIHTITGFKNINIIEREKNFGLADNIIDGVTTITNQYGKIIVLEDDIVVSPVFLEYMNKGLEFYQEDKKICSIAGNCFLNPCQYKHMGVHALSIISSWGWATWKDRWCDFYRNDAKLLDIINNKSLHNSFDYDKSYPYIKMAKLQLKRKINSWAIYWYAHNFLQRKLTIYPNSSLITNNGFDGSGYHCKKENIKKSLPTKNYTIDFPSDPHEENNIRAQVKRNLKKTSKFKQWVYKSPLFFTFALKILNQIKIAAHRKNIGKSTLISKKARVTGWSSVSIGHNTIIGEYAWINVNEKKQKAIVIGNYCYLGTNTFLSSGNQIIIQDYTMMVIGSKILGANHIIQNPFEPYISTGVSNHQRTIIGYNTWIGADAIIMGDIEIGYGSIIGAGSVVTQNIPPFSIAVGSPARVIKRYDFSQSQWVRIEEYNEEKNKRLIPTADEYLSILQSKQIMMPYMALGKEMGDLF